MGGQHGLGQATATPWHVPCAAPPPPRCRDASCCHPSCDAAAARASAPWRCTRRSRPSSARHCLAGKPQHHFEAKPDPRPCGRPPNVTSHPPATHGCPLRCAGACRGRGWMSWSTTTCRPQRRLPRTPTGSGRWVTRRVRARRRGLPCAANRGRKGGAPSQPALLCQSFNPITPLLLCHALQTLLQFLLNPATSPPELPGVLVRDPHPGLGVISRGCAVRLVGMSLAQRHACMVAVPRGNKPPAPWPPGAAALQRRRTEPLPIKQLVESAGLMALQKDE